MGKISLERINKLKFIQFATLLLPQRSTNTQFYYYFYLFSDTFSTLFFRPRLTFIHFNGQKSEEILFFFHWTQLLISSYSFNARPLRKTNTISTDSGRTNKKKESFFFLTNLKTIKTFVLMQRIRKSHLHEIILN